MPRAMHPCPTPGCPELVEHGTRRCPDCSHQHEQARGTRQQRGYDAAHDRERRRWAPRVRRGGVLCARCHEPIAAGQRWDLGHNDERTRWTGPEHEVCNRSAGGRAAHGLDPIDPTTR